MLCIAVDEEQHMSCVEIDEFVNYNNLRMDLTARHISISYNPERYNDAQGKRINPPFDEQPFLNDCLVLI